MNIFLKSVSKSLVIGIALMVLFVGQQALALSAPTGVSITNITATGATISWDAPTGFLTTPNTSGIQFHKVFYKKTGAFGSDVVYAQHPALTQTFTTLSAGTYDVWVVASGGVDSPESAHKTFATTGAPPNTGNPPPTTPDTTPPTMPSNIVQVASGTTTTKATITWSASTDESGGSGLAGYNMYRADQWGLPESSPYNSSLLSAPPVVFQPLTKNTSYVRYISAVDTAGNESGKAFTTFKTNDDVIVASNNPTCTNGATNYPTCTGDAGGGGYNFNVKFINPLGPNGPQDIPTLLNKILDALMLFLVPIVVLFIIYAGFLFVMAQGNDAKLTKAKSVLGWTLVGAAILLGAKIITTVLSSTVTNILK